MEALAVLAQFRLFMAVDQISQNGMANMRHVDTDLVRRAPYAFTERGLYMLATILNSDRAVRATKAIIETYAQVRSMVRDMEAIQTEKAGSPEQANLLTRAGHKLAGLIGDNLSTVSRKTTIELNLALLKITHEVAQGKE